MLEFNPEHKSLNTSLKRNKDKLNIRNLVISGLLISSIFLFNGCSKKVECSVSDLHAHSYFNGDSFYTYMVNEREYTMDGWQRTGDFIVIDKETEALLDYQNQSDLIKISDNQAKIDEITANHKDYVEYEYLYTYLRQVPMTRIVNGKSQVYYINTPTVGYKWTTDPYHENLTGKQRIIHYVYIGYKIEKDEKGNFQVVESEPVNSLSELPTGFDYIKPNFYKKVLQNDKTVEINEDVVQGDTQKSK